jgi:hypothetical protein
MTEVIVAKKKRGRKPKNYINSAIKLDDNINKIVDNINSEDEKIIFHLPITINEINSYDNDNMSIFIKSESDINIKIDHKSELSEVSEVLKISETSESKVFLNNSINNIYTHVLKFNNNTKCWWCRNCFMTHPIQLPEDYYNNTFYCIGHFCSYNCAISYNLDLNDIITSKRISLINLLYYKTYTEFNNIIPAPHWITLEEYGGKLSINEFRENSMNNTKEYLVLHPPIVSRQMQIEESYKQKKFKDTSNYSEMENNYTIKRNKPINNKQMNLEVTMGLIKKIK